MPIRHSKSEHDFILVENSIGIPCDKELEVAHELCLKTAAAQLLPCESLNL